MKIIKIYIKKGKNLILLSLIILLFLTLRHNRWEGKEITLRQAYEMAYEEVYKDNSSIMLDYITSVDIEEDTYNNQGHNGKRKHWNIDFAVPNTGSHYIVEIRNGRIINWQEVVGLKKEDSELIEREDIAFDSNDIINSSNIQFEIMPGRIWAIGYHFNLRKKDGHAYQTLVCYDENMNLCNIKMDVKTGEIVDGKYKARIGGGIVNEDGNVLVDTRFQINRLINGSRENEIVAAGFKYVNEIEYLPLILAISDSKVKEYEVVEDIYDLVCLGDYIYYINAGGIGRIEKDTGKDEVVYTGEVRSCGVGKNNLVISTDNNIVLVNDQELIVQYDCEERNSDVVRIIDVNDRNEIFFSNGKSIYKLSEGNTIEVVSYENDNIKDIECYDDDLYIITEHNIMVFDVINNKAKVEIKNKYELDLCLINYAGKQYMMSSTNEIIIYVGKGEKEQIIQEISDCGVVTDLCHLSVNRKVYSYFSRFEWQDMPERGNYE